MYRKNGRKVRKEKKRKELTQRKGVPVKGKPPHTGTFEIITDSKDRSFQSGQKLVDTRRCAKERTHFLLDVFLNLLRRGPARVGNQAGMISAVVSSPCGRLRAYVRKKTGDANVLHAKIGENLSKVGMLKRVNSALSFENPYRQMIRIPAGFGPGVTMLNVNSEAPGESITISIKSSSKNPVVEFT